MKRVGCAVLWTFLFFCLTVFGFGLKLAFEHQGDQEKFKAASEEFNRQWSTTIFLGALSAAVILSALRLLPGTRRRPTATNTEPDWALALKHPGGAATLESSSPSQGWPSAAQDPPTRPTVVVPVGVPESPPAELIALGPPIAVHPPGLLAGMSGSARFATFVIGLVLLLGPVALARATGPEQIPPSVLGPVAIGGLIASLLCFAFAWPSPAYTYQVHRDALVVIDRKTLRIIPWDQVQALVPAVPFFKDFTVVTRDGQEVPIKSNVREDRELVGTVYVRVRDHLLPTMLAKARSGQMVVFGPLGISSFAVMYKGTTVRWDEVSRLVIVYGSGFHKLMIYRSGALAFWPFCQLNLNTLPNYMVLLDVLKQIAPPRLLVDEARW